MKLQISLLIVVVALPAMCGCGSGPSQADMMKHAVRRSGRQGDTSAAAPSAENESAIDHSREERSVSTNEDRTVDDPPTDAGSPPAADTSVEVTVDSNPALSRLPKPDTPLSESERRQHSISNLELIAKAFQRYLKENGHFPAPAVYHSDGRPLLSWRVALLPCLGHQALYDRFRLDQSWDSSENSELLAEIPAVYQSPECFDDRTNYLVPEGSGTIFPGRRGITIRKIEDGVDNTLLVIEADDDAATPWTKPVDYRVRVSEPCRNLGTLRSGQFFAVWAGGQLGQIDCGITRQQWKAMLTIDGGESFSASAVSSPAVAEAPQEEVEQAVSVVTDQSPVEQSSARTVSAVGVSDSVGSRSLFAPARTPVPDQREQRSAMAQFRSLYRSEYKDAKTIEAKRSLADRMLQRAATVQTNPAGYFVALELTHKIALEAGDVSIAMTAAERILEAFDAEPAVIKGGILSATMAKELTESNIEIVLREATGLIEPALEENEYGAAEQMVAVALAAARRTRDPQQIAEVMLLKKRVEAAESAFANVVKALDRLAIDPDDPHANLNVGAYYCFFKSRWQDGLPLLAGGSNPLLAELAARELRLPTSPEEQVVLADAWWENSEEQVRFQAAMRSRAAYWYVQALPLLDPGLAKIKAEVRVRQAISE